MKEVEIILGLILVVTGSILLEMNGCVLMNFLSLGLMSIGVIVYLKTVDSLDETKKKRNERKEIF